MPIYEYKCERCEKVFEVRQKFADEPLTTHEECGGPVHRLLSAPAFQFKGSGWYITDYARAGGGKESKSESKNESKSESKSDTGNGSKTAETSSSKPASSDSSTKSDTK